jgi:hypothetical protein
MLCSACVAWLGLRLSARLASLGSCQHHSQAADASACAACWRPRAKMGGGAVLALPGLRWGQAADVLACTAHSRSSAKMGGGVSGARLLGLVCLAWFAWLGLLGSICSAQFAWLASVSSR